MERATGAGKMGFSEALSDVGRRRDGEERTGAGSILREATRGDLPSASLEAEGPPRTMLMYAGGTRVTVGKTGWRMARCVSEKDSQEAGHRDRAGGCPAMQRPWRRPGRARGGSRAGRGFGARPWAESLGQAVT